MDTTRRFAVAILCFIVCVAPGYVAAQSQEIFTGIWVGEILSSVRLAVTAATTPDSSYTATLNVIDQNSGEIPCDRVIITADTMYVQVASADIEIAGRFDPDFTAITGEFRQHGLTFPLVLQKKDTLPTGELELNRPQNPEPPFPYIVEDITYQNTDAGVILAATLTLPPGDGPFPAVVLLTGSGQQNRDEEILGHRPFLVLADHLTRQGIAVLRSDDRGIGGSGGIFALSTTADFAGDALAGIVYLKTRPEIDHRNIGLIGHSEGGMIAPIAAAESDDVSFIVLMAAPGVTMREISAFQRENLLRQSDMSEGDIALAVSWFDSIFAISASNLSDADASRQIQSFVLSRPEKDLVRLGFTDEMIASGFSEFLSPWVRYAMAYDPHTLLGRVTVPVLAINGEKDTQVPAAENLDAIKEALTNGGNYHVKTVELLGLNHLFQTADTGLVNEYGSIEETFAPAALEVISEWILEVTHSGEAGK